METIQAAVRLRRPERRSGAKVGQQLLGGGYLRAQDIELAHEQGVELFLPPKSARQPGNRGRELEPKPGDSPAILRWKRRMRSPEGQEIYKRKGGHQRDRQRRAAKLSRAGANHVRGLKKARCVALWCALAYNVMRFAAPLLS